MANLYIQQGTTESIEIALSFSFLGVNVGVTQVTQLLPIPIEKPYLYYNKRLLAALNNGTISQSVYNTIIELQSNEFQLHLLNGNLDIAKETIVDLIAPYNIAGVNLEGTVSEIINNLLTEGYQIIKKI
jgi:hypothetical protein